MKVLQLIDSLYTGGAERVAVNIANALTSRIEASFLCATREEGLLKENISKDVGYLFLEKKASIDFKAIKKLNRFIKVNQIAIIHAHSSSFFLATLVKILNPRLVLIWHDHYGASEFLKERPKFVLKWCSKYFNHVLCVNSRLEQWSRNILKVKSTSFLSNFAVIGDENPKTFLKGLDSKRIICLANLRSQKDHITLLKAFQQTLNEHQEWTLHLVGQDFNDDYSRSIKEYIKNEHLEECVFIYGSCVDTYHVLQQSSIGVLSSISEGLPLALLEYGLIGLPVIATDVGDCSNIISNSNEGLIVPPNSEKALTDALNLYINNINLRVKAGSQLQAKVQSSFSESSVMERLMEIYKCSII